MNLSEPVHLIYAISTVMMEILMSYERRTFSCCLGKEKYK
jgi:hypothetical protein